MSNVDLLRLIHNLIRLGTIAEVDHARARVRVKSGELLTDWLPWVASRAGTTRDWNPPTLGEQVIVFSPGGDLAAGIALSGIFSEAHPAPSSEPNISGRWLSDGTHIKYDHDTHRLSIECVGDIELAVDGIRERFFKQHLENAGVRYRGPNQCRHTYASQLLSSGVAPIQWVAEQMGHTSPAMIYKHYGRWISEDGANINALIEAALKLDS